MSEVTVIPPAIFEEAYFTFKEPVAKYIKNKLNTSQISNKFVVTSVYSIREMVEVELRDPFIEVYNLLGITDYDYRKDLLNNIAVYTLKHLNNRGTSVHIKVPLTYISDYGSVSEIPYVNRILVLDLGKLPKDLSIEHCYGDIREAITSRVGVIPQLKEVSIGNPEKVDRESSEVREALRINSITVNKTNATKLAEVTHKYSQLLQRLSDLNISLGQTP